MKTIDHQLVGQAFDPTSRITRLPSGEIHLWQWNSADVLAPREFNALARSKLIHLLQGYAGSDTTPMIETGEHGKPFVADSNYPHFNMSHSSDSVMFAFSRDHEVGVDIEKTSFRRRFSALELAERFFTAEEFARLAALDEPAQNVAFVQLWTCKEAVLKALGHGLSFGLDRLQFALDADASAHSLEAIAAEAGIPQDWQIHRFVPRHDLLGSLAWRGPAQRVRTYTLDSGA
ncbi:MAG TPA: 4'-phosphopantetheinyl transferase superfamily protein [Dokdonella sp.]|uniref:4'-phosphopantetheinyl transferase family protein n=1 Tax=Dokdonella sp. TaxID=2291710 RepID=UPI002D7F5AD2|nr:4'-phosphopantetheinyl transferase superfamily protein [Dokdonella sp.]HET9033276.1 4'-phosphopantetheinyl transferase superfamily protein [Dokdonella sp.]